MLATAVELHLHVDGSRQQEEQRVALVALAHDDVARVRRARAPPRSSIAAISSLTEPFEQLLHREHRRWLRRPRHRLAPAVRLRSTRARRRRWCNERAPSAAQRAELRVPARPRVGVREHQRHVGDVERMLEIDEHLDCGTRRRHLRAGSRARRTSHRRALLDDRAEHAFHRREVEVAFELVDHDAVARDRRGVLRGARAHPVRACLIAADSCGG